jgi:hypothetical protein
MKTVTVSSRSRVLKELLALAAQNDVLLQTSDGTQFMLSRLTQAESFEIGASNELRDEVKESRKNQAFMNFLDRRGTRAKGQRGTRLADVRRKLLA